MISKTGSEPLLQSEDLQKITLLYIYLWPWCFLCRFGWQASSFLKPATLKSIFEISFLLLNINTQLFLKPVDCAFMFGMIVG